YHFDKDEKIEWVNKLNNLEIKIEKIEKVSSEDKQNISRDLERLKEDLDLMQKKIWLHNAIYKITKFLFNTVAKSGDPQELVGKTLQFLDYKKD
ncbi:MAG: hypothetical protein IID61_03155, partial [SAR324 cluster bacterium]|nr:hypothetical protein [SAR324 cluster bacterium]